MAISGIGAAQAAMIQALGNTVDTGSDTQGLFASLLSSQLQETADDGVGTGTSDVMSGDNLTSLMLASLLSGGSNLVALSLGSALLKTQDAGLSSSTLLLSSAYRSALAAYGVAAGGARALMPTSASKPATPVVTSNETNRSAALYRQVIDQFDVENSARYAVNKKGTGDTYCNIFVWDVTRAMGAEIPYYVDPNTGAPMSYPNVEGAMYMSANRMHDWLGEHGSKYGWFQVSAQEAQMLANQGYPVVSALKRSGHGHVQVVCPSHDGTYDVQRGVTVAQAGRVLSGYTSTSSIYSHSSLENVVYYAHA